MKKPAAIGFSLLSGILLFAAWPVSPFTFLIFVAFVPLLYVAENVENKRLFFLLSFIAMLTWNASATWWIWNSTDVGSIAAFIANSLLMCLPWWGYRVFRRRFNRRIGYMSLVFFWMTFEYIHLNWQLSWPWLTLGNVFASNPGWVQWYEYTGTSGGTLWVLMVNLLLYEQVRLIADKRFEARRLAAPLAAIVIPFILSWLSMPAVKPNTQTANVVIIQPNIDPYSKFAEGAAGPQVQLLLNQTAGAIDSNTKLVIWPETALTGSGVIEDELNTYPTYQPIFAFLRSHPGLTIQTGVEVFKVYGNEKATPTARRSPSSGVYFDDFNAAVSLQAGQPLQFYHKSRLVPGVETLPTFLNFMAPVFEQFGGTTGGYGRQAEAGVLKQPGQPYITAPIICYESIYGEYVGTYVAKGANLLTIMTNDGWWGNTPGHKQHLQYARLRAIETRRWVARSANTGISAVINDRGDIMATQPWATQAVIKYNIPVLTGETFYVAYGDILSKIALVIASLFFAFNLVLLIRERINKKGKKPAHD